MQSITLSVFVSGVLVSSVLLPSFAMAESWKNPGAQGNGCPSSATSVIAAGDEIAWVFSEFGFDLLKQGAANKNCNLSADAQVPKGFYLNSFTQVLSYAGVKTTLGSELNIGIRTMFFGSGLAKQEHYYPSGVEFDTPYTELSGTADFKRLDPPRNWCGAQGRAPGNLRVALSAMGKVNKAGATLSFAGQGFNMKFAATTGILPCS
jgi:hypothetical protein